MQQYIDLIKNADQKQQIMLGCLALIIVLMLYKIIAKASKGSKKEDFAIAERQNLISTMSETQYIKMKNDSQCKLASENFCSAWCGDYDQQIINSHSNKVMEKCGSQFPVLRTCPMECTLPKWTQMQGGFNANVMTEKVYPSYINPFTSNSTLPPVGQKLNYNDTWKQQNYN